MVYKKKSLHFKFLKPLNILLLSFAIISLILTGIFILLFAINDYFSSNDTFSLIRIIANVLLISFPFVLFVLCFISSLRFSLVLKANNICINKFSRLESLIHTDIYLLEKTKVITDGSMEIKKVIPLTVAASEQYLDQWVSNLLKATNDEGVVFTALKQKYDFDLSAGVVKVVQYNDQNKYSGVSFKGNKTMVLGEPEYTPIKNKAGIIKRCEEYVNSGYLVLVLAESKEIINENGFNGEAEPIALIILKEHIRDDFFDTLQTLKNENSIIKVISSDDAFASSVLAAEVGIENADKYISLKGMSVEDIKKIHNDYAVFGDADNEQKLALVKAFKEDKKTVTTVNNDKNNIALMRSSNFSITFDDANDEIKKEADVILNNGSFKSLPLLLDKSSNFINYLSKVAALSLAKLIFVALVIICYLFASQIDKELLIKFPLAFNQFFIWDFAINGVGAYSLLVDDTNEKVRGYFINNAFRKAIPFLALQVAGIFTILILYVMQNNNVINLGIYSFETAVSMSVIMFNLFSLLIYYSIYRPFNKKKKIIAISICAYSLLVLFIDGIISYLTNKNTSVFQISYLSMNGPAYMALAISIIILASLYLFINGIINILKEAEGK